MKKVKKMKKKKICHRFYGPQTTSTSRQLVVERLT